jgi:tRNA(Arg) A34 adenosine deaminase TadA
MTLHLRPVHGSNTLTPSHPVMLPFYVYKFVQSQAQQVIELINASCSLPSHLRHLKRIRALKGRSRLRGEPEEEGERHLQILVMPTEGLSLVDFLSVYPELLMDNILKMDGFEIVSVPARMAGTRKEWEAQHKEWPQSFHHHMHEKRKLQELELMSNIDTHDKEHSNELRLVDPVSNKLICRVETEIKDPRQAMSPDSPHIGSCDSPNVLIHPVMRLIKAKAALLPASPDDYLCTGLVALLPEEPCLMCAMSLTHSRIRTVLLAKDRDDCNSGSNAKLSHGPYRTWGLHEMSGLNHHYPVYEMLSQIDE